MDLYGALPSTAPVASWAKITPIIDYPAMKTSIIALQSLLTSCSFLPHDPINMCLREIISNSYHAPLSALYPRRQRRLPALSSLFLGPAVCCKHRTAGFSHTVHKIETHDVYRSL